MNARQKIRMYILIVVTILIISVVIAVNYNAIYLDVLKTLSLPYTLVLGGYFSTEIAKNINKKI